MDFKTGTSLFGSSGSMADLLRARGSKSDDRPGHHRWSHSPHPKCCKGSSWNKLLGLIFNNKTAYNSIQQHINIYIYITIINPCRPYASCLVFFSQHEQVISVQGSHGFRWSGGSFQQLLIGWRLLKLPIAILIGAWSIHHETLIFSVIEASCYRFLVGK